MISLPITKNLRTTPPSTHTQQDFGLTQSTKPPKHKITVLKESPRYKVTAQPGVSEFLS